MMAAPDWVQVNAFTDPDEWYVSVLASDGMWTLVTLCASAKHAEVVAGVVRDGIAAALRAERERAEDHPLSPSLIEATADLQDAAMWDVRKFVENLPGLDALSHEDGWTLTRTETWEGLRERAERAEAAYVELEARDVLLERIESLTREVERSREALQEADRAIDHLRRLTTKADVWMAVAGEWLGEIHALIRAALTSSAPEEG